MTSPLSDRLREPRFGDVVENGWASESNPTRRGFFVRAFVRTGRMNPGLTWEITDGKGKFWELQPRVIGERLTLTEAADALSRARDVEGIARVIAESYGVDPDDDAPISVICTADNRPLPWWQAYEEQARAVSRFIVGEE